jgi:hypothetical protein
VTRLTQLLMDANPLNLFQSFIVTWFVQESRKKCK